MLQQALAVSGVGFTQIDAAVMQEIEAFFGMSVPMICEADRSSPGEFFSTSRSVA